MRLAPPVQRHSRRHVGRRALAGICRGIDRLGAVIAPVHLDRELAGRLRDQKAQANSRGKECPARGRRLRRGAVIGRAAAGGWGVEVVVSRFRHSSELRRLPAERETRSDTSAMGPGTGPRTPSRCHSPGRPDRVSRRQPALGVHRRGCPLSAAWNRSIFSSIATNRRKRR